MIYDKDPAVKNLVQNFSSYGITIKTKDKKPPAEVGQKSDANNADAMRAAEKVLQQPG